MDRRRFLFASLAGAFGAALGASLGATTASASGVGVAPAIRLPEPDPIEAAPAMPEDGEIVPAQWGPDGRGPPGRGRYRRRCRMQPRRVAVRDRWGRVHYRTVYREVCR